MRSYFNEKNDELMVLDIDATTNDIKPNYEKIMKYAAECRMFYEGGGIKSVEQPSHHSIRRKIALSSGVQEISLMKICIRLGTQSVVLDVKKDFFKVWSTQWKAGSGLDHLQFQVQEYGAEIVINSIDRDGMNEGDLNYKNNKKTSTCSSYFSRRRRVFR